MFPKCCFCLPGETAGWHKTSFNERFVLTLREIKAEPDSTEELFLGADQVDYFRRRAGSSRRKLAVSVRQPQ